MQPLSPRASRALLGGIPRHAARELACGPNLSSKARSIHSRNADGERQVVVGQWGLIPRFAKEPKLKYSTNNARIETAPTAATFKLPWSRGQRCLIPAQSFDEPNWESGKNEWRRFRRADGRAWGLAGLWNTWTDKSTGEVWESYSMLTMNADAHPLMRRMHKPDPKLAPHEQDKRSRCCHQARQPSGSRVIRTPHHGDCPGQAVVHRRHSAIADDLAGRIDAHGLGLFDMGKRRQPFRG